MELSISLAILASFVHLCGYAVYNTAALRGKKPNLVPWTIWGVMAILNTLTYGLMTGDGIKAMLAASGTVAAIVTFVVALVKGGSFRALGKTDKKALLIGFVAVVAWKLSDASIANYFVLTAVTAGFVPLFRALWENPKSEVRLPWLLWSISTTLGVVVVILRFNGNYSDFVSPVVYMVLHTATWLLTFRELPQRNVQIA